jgi:hypothetical protein
MALGKRIQDTERRDVGSVEGVCAIEANQTLLPLEGLKIGKAPIWRGTDLRRILHPDCVTESRGLHDHALGHVHLLDVRSQKGPQLLHCFLCAHLFEVEVPIKVELDDVQIDLLLHVL